MRLFDPLGAEDVQLTGICYRVVNMLRRRATPSRLELDAIGQLIAHDLLQRWSTEPPSPRRRTPRLTARQLRQALDHLNGHFTEDVRLDELADYAGLSSFHFARGFKAATGVSPHRYSIRLRMDQARKLLLQNTPSVTAVAAAVGYDDPGYFARVFGREVGVTPSAYRREQAG